MSKYEEAWRYILEKQNIIKDKPNNRKEHDEYYKHRFLIEDLIERATPKEVEIVFEGMGGFPVNVCTVCKHVNKKNNFCPNCGQALGGNKNE